MQMGVWGDGQKYGPAEAMNEVGVKGQGKREATARCVADTTPPSSCIVPPLHRFFHSHPLAHWKSRICRGWIFGLEWFQKFPNLTVA
jgi:hypothetical protein